jgi:hypothetical protein
MVFLLMLTILGITVMQTASLEGHMAGNAQETNRAFQAAASAIDYVLTDDTIFSGVTVSASTSQQVPYAGVPGDVQVTAEFKDSCSSNLPRARNRQQLNDINKYTGAVYQVTSSATTAGQGSAVTTQGVARTIKKTCP